MIDTATLLSYLALGIAAYLIGCIPTGVVVARLYRNIDVTQIGSQRTGATNVARSLGLGAGAVVLAGDLAKGALAVAVAASTGLGPLGLGLAWFLAIIGHMRSIFLHGRGGRGVGTGLGGLAVVLAPLFGLVVMSGALIAGTTRYISLGSICGCTIALVGGVAAWATGRIAPELLPFFVINPLLVIWAHRDNIERLRSGQERRFGQRIREGG
jgi:acyl phosphate:glycerol-3-phosphate acyltransferase